MLDLIAATIELLTIIFKKPLSNIYNHVTNSIKDNKSRKYRGRVKRNKKYQRVKATIIDVKQNSIFSCKYYDNDKSKRKPSDRTYFCYIDATPQQCEEFEIVIKNIGDEEITLISATCLGEKQEKPKPKPKKVYIPPQGEYKYRICDVSYFPRNNNQVVLYIKCINCISHHRKFKCKCYFQTFKLDIKVQHEIVSYEFNMIDCGMKKMSRNSLNL